jgi:elongation factor 1-beta
MLEDPKAMDAFIEGIAKKIRADINKDGLVWAKEHKIITIAFGAKKLQMSAIIEDDKIETEEDIFDKIREWEDDVQSVDVASMQKL